LLWLLLRPCPLAGLQTASKGDNKRFVTLRRLLIHKMGKIMAHQMGLLLLGLLVCTALAADRDTECKCLLGPDWLCCKPLLC
jgi:hypothetical protein